MFKSIADIKKSMTVGSKWHTIFHPTIRDMGIREVSKVQSNSFAFRTVKPNGEVTDSWCDWPKKSNVVFHASESFSIVEDGKTILTYTKIKED